MYHNILTILTTSTIAIHAMLGCCAHHLHADCLPGEHASTTEIDGHEHAACEHHTHTGSNAHLDGYDSQSDHPHQHDQEPCDEADCQFVSVQRIDDLLLSISLDSLISFNQVLSTQMALVSHPLQGRFEQTIHSSPTPDPLHALKQVWLL